MRHALALARCLPFCLAGPAGASDDEPVEKRTAYLDCTP